MLSFQKSCICVCACAWTRVCGVLVCCSTSLLSDATRCSHPTLSISCPSPRISHFSREITRNAGCGHEVSHSSWCFSSVKHLDLNAHTPGVILSVYPTLQKPKRGIFRGDN